MISLTNELKPAVQLVGETLSTRLSPYGFITRHCNVFIMLFSDEGGEKAEHSENINVTSRILPAD